MLKAVDINEQESTAYSSSIVPCVFVAEEKCLPSRCLAVAYFSGSTIPAFRRRGGTHTQTTRCSRKPPSIFRVKIILQVNFQNSQAGSIKRYHGPDSYRGL
jgi:hypothetical protein